MAAEDTKDQILDAAERIFAEQGFDAASLRTITSEAGVNLASIHYHYGSKEALIEAVLFRRIEYINQQRLQLLDACEAAGEGGVPDLECLVHSFVAPSIRLIHDPHRGGEFFVRLMGLAHSTRAEHLWTMFRERFGPFIDRYMSAFSRALPELDPEVLIWNFFFMLGSMAHTMASIRQFPVIAPGVSPTSDPEVIIDRLVMYTAAGMRAAQLSGQTGGTT